MLIDVFSEAKGLRAVRAVQMGHVIVLVVSCRVFIADRKRVVSGSMPM